MSSRLAHRRAETIAGALTLAAMVVLTIALLPARAQSTIPIKLDIVTKVIPNKAGTPAHPQGVVIDTRAKLGIPEAYEPPLVDVVDVWFPRDGIYNGHKFPVCAERTMRRKGPKGCPRRSIMGHGTVTATADHVRTYPKVTVINGGTPRVWFYTVMSNPARVEEPVEGKITRLTSGKWGYHLHTRIPRKLQIVAGIPIVARGAHFRVGREDWIASISCPRDRKWRYHVRLTFTTGQVRRYNGSTPCRR